MAPLVFLFTPVHRACPSIIIHRVRAGPGLSVVLLGEGHRRGIVDGTSLQPGCCSLLLWQATIFPQGNNLGPTKRNSKLFGVKYVDKARW